MRDLVQGSPAGVGDPRESPWRPVPDTSYVDATRQFGSHGAIAGLLPRSAVPDADDVARMVRSGWVGPVDEPADEARAQLMLRTRNVCLLADSFAEAGFFPVIDHVIADAAMLEAMVGWLHVRPLWLVTLAPDLTTARERNRQRPEQERIDYDVSGLHDTLGRELRDRGWFFDTSSLTVAETVQRIMSEAPRRADVTGRR